jgi:ACS family allantoate permease-like MFS transporter
LPLGKYSAACIIIWGLILSCFAGVKNYAGAIAIRLFLGVFEAAVTPGFALITSQVCFVLAYTPKNINQTSTCSLDT